MCCALLTSGPPPWRAAGRASWQRRLADRCASGGMSRRSTIADSATGAPRARGSGSARSTRPAGGRVWSQAQSSSTWASSASRSPVLSMMRSAPAARSSRVAWRAMRARASASSIPRRRTNRSTATSTGVSTTIVAASPWRGFSARSGMSSTTTASVPAAGLDPLARSPPRPPGGRWRSGPSAPPDPRTRWPPAPARSSSPSGWSTPGPKRSTMAASTGWPGRWSSRVMASASTMTAPRAASRADTVDLPEPMPPVSPTRITSGWRALGRSSGSVSRRVSGGVSRRVQPWGQLRRRPRPRRLGSAAAGTSDISAGRNSASSAATGSRRIGSRPEPARWAEANRRAAPRHPHRAPRSTRPTPPRARRRR